MTHSPFAQSYAAIFERGYKPIPLIPREKRPGIYKGVATGWIGMPQWAEWADKDLEEWRLDQWSNWPDANIGVIHTDELIGFDFDNDVAGCHDLIKQVLAEIPGAIVRRKGAKGYLQYARGEGVTSAVYRVNKENALEILAKGRQSVLPTSIHPSGSTYVWLTPDTLETTDISELPLITPEVIERIEDILREHGWDAKEHHEAVATGHRAEIDSSGGIMSVCNQYAMRDLDRWVPELGIANLERKGSGGWRGTAHWRPGGSGKPLAERKRNLNVDPAGIKDFGDDRGYTPIDLVMAALGVDVDKAWSFLWQRVGPELPPWSPKRKVVEAADEDTRIAVEQQIHAEVERINAEMKMPGSDVSNAYSLKAAGGLIGAVANWCISRSRRPCEEYALFSGITATAALFGRKYLSPTGCGINVYTVGIGRSGFGKEAPLATLRALFGEMPAWNRYLGSSDFASDGAIYRILKTSPSCAMPMDEIGMFFQGVQGRNVSSHERRVKKGMLELYSGSSSAWAARAVASEEDTREQIHFPTMSILGMTTPSELFNGLTQDNVNDGLLARLIFAIREDRPQPKDSAEGSEQMPAVLKSMVEAAIDTCPGDSTERGNRELNKYLEATTKCEPMRVPWADLKAKQQWEQIENWALVVEDNEIVPAGIVNRAAENVVRLATLRALSRDGDAARVNISDVSWGASIVELSVRMIAQAIDEHMSVNQTDKDMLRVQQVIKRAGEKGATLGNINDKARGITSRDMEDILKRLESMSRIAQRPPDRTKPGPKTMRYVYTGG